MATTIETLRPGYEKDLAEIRSDLRLLKWLTGTTLAGVAAVVVRVFTA